MRGALTPHARKCIALSLRSEANAPSKSWNKPMRNFFPLAKKHWGNERQNIISCKLIQRNFFSTVSSGNSSSGEAQIKSPENTSSSLPSQANVVVVGGGIIGSSIAYHLSKFGVPDVILLERDKLTSGTTWHAAGLINTFGSLSSTSTSFRKYTKELFSSTLKEETGVDPGFMPVGFIELACDDDHLYYYRKVAAFNRYCGVDVREIGPEEVLNHFPLCETKDVLAGFYVPTDGRVDPYGATMAFAKGAKMFGAKIFEGSVVTGVTTTRISTSSNGEIIITAVPRVTGVTLENGQTVEANVVVNCAGMWARQFGELCGVNVPNQAAEHYYLITEPIPNLDPSWPIVEDSSRYAYIRPEGAGLMVGLFEGKGAAWSVNSVPNNASFWEIEPDWERMGPYLETAMERVPALNEVGLKKFFCGPESFTPDGCPVVGESAELRNYFVAAGLNSIGILTSGGIGKLLAEWIRDGSAPSDTDITGINIRRFQSYQSNPKYREERVSETLGNVYKLHYPDYSPATCRGAKRSILHDRLANLGAYFKDVSGWESPAWYDTDAISANRLPSRGQESFDREVWFPLWEKEHTQCREHVALFDMSFMSKFLVQGEDAGKFLNQLSTANVDGPSGTITYTQWLNEGGRMEADLTVTKLQEDKFLVVATDTMHNHVFSHMKDRLTNKQHVTVTDVTGSYAQINLQGPNSRQLLQELTSVDVEHLPFRSATEIDIGYARVWSMRITYVGELGYELFIPVENATHVYDLIVESGKEFLLGHSGLRALGSLRLEKGYRDMGHDMDNTDTLLECGLGFTCDFEKPGGFIGREQVLKQKADSKEQGGLRRRMVNVLVNDPEPLLHHGEILFRNGQPMGEIRSASYGHTVGGAIGLSMLESSERPITKTFLEEGDWEIQIGGKKFDCRVSLPPYYDPKNTRIRSKDA